MSNGIKSHDRTEKSASSEASAGTNPKRLSGKLVGGGLAVLCILGLVAYAAERVSKPETPAEPAAASSTELSGDEVRVQGSYAFGYSLGAQIGGNIRAQNIDVDVEQFMEGFKAAMTGGQPRMNDADMQKAFDALQRRQEQVAAAAQAKRQQDNEKFLAENGKKPDVETTGSGLQYQVLKSGSGKKAGAHSLVVVHYEGRLLDGTVFDSSIQRGTPAAMRVDGVIRGWQEALQAMHEGDKWRLWIPSELGYAAEGAGRMIPPHSVLVFEVELIDVKDENTPDGPAPPPIE